MEAFNVQPQPMNSHAKHQLEQELGYGRQDKRPRSQPLDALRCPRCDSTNTKFCYYNNYSLSQPRYFCKGCRRYWTHGGSLRNVPVGGGCRKNRRPPSSRRNLDHQCLLTTSSRQLCLGDSAAATLLTENPTPNPNPNANIVMSPFFDLLMSGLLDTTNMAYGYQSLYDGQMLVPFGVVGGEEIYRNMMDVQWQAGGDVNVMNGNGNGMMGMEWARDGCFGAVGSSWHDLVNSFPI